MLSFGCDFGNRLPLGDSPHRQTKSANDQSRSTTLSLSTGLPGGLRPLNDSLRGRSFVCERTLLYWRRRVKVARGVAALKLKTTPMETEPVPGFALVIGLDRADQKVDLCQLGASQAASGCSTVSTSPEALLNWFETLRKDHPFGRIGLCLEAPAGNLLAFFATHAPWLELYPVNPLTLKRFRETFVLSRANDDGKDVLYLARSQRSTAPLATGRSRDCTFAAACRPSPRSGR